MPLKKFRKITIDMILKREDLVKAYEQKNLKNYTKSLELFERLYNENPESFSYRDKVNYAWMIIKVRIENSQDKDEFFRSVEYITNLLPQANLNVNSSCPYTASVFKVLIKFKKDKNYIDMIPWLEKLDPELLDEKPHRSYGRQQKTRKELYYFFASKAYLDDFQFERCIEVSQTALDTLAKFNDDSDSWFHWRIAKSLNQLNRLQEALPHYLQVIKVKHDWYMYRDIAEIYCILGKPYDALDYLCPAVLAKGSYATKMGLYYLCYKVLKTFNMEMALKHAQFYSLLLDEKGYSAPYEIEQLNIDAAKFDKNELGMEITRLWTQYKYKDQKRQHGTVIKFLEDKNFGFIRSDDGKEIFFHRNEFKGYRIFVGQNVSFFTEENFDKSKNRKSLKAVIVRSE